jgi:hypothetical protein
MSEYLAALGADLGELARDAFRSGGVRVFVKTNLGPEFPVSGGGGGLADALGLQAGVVLRDRQGNRIASYGGYPPTDPFRVALLVAAAGALGFLLLRGVLRR